MKSALIFMIIAAFIINNANCQKIETDYNIDLSKINYEIVGTGMPIIMIHGMGVDSRVMKNSFESIFIDQPNYWKRIYLDLPGMGKTDELDWIRNSDDMLFFLELFIGQIIPNENFIVAGYSYGGYLARGLISKMEEKIIGGIFICPLIIPEDKKRNISTEIFYNRDTVFYNKADLETKALIDFFLVNQDSITIKRFNEDIVSGHKIGNRIFIDKIRNNPKNYRFSKKISKNFKIFYKPTLFITAKQDILVGFTDAQQILNFFPDNIFVVIDSAGHAVQIDKPIEFEFNVKQYLNKLEINK